MIDKVGYIRNPLTVIAMFAGIAEVSGTVVLPLLAEDTQRIYVWFLMSFPCLLVLAFFGTLFFKHHVLYAPSDFKDENIFANMFKPGLPILKAEKLQEDISIGSYTTDAVSADDDSSSSASASFTDTADLTASENQPSQSEIAAQTVLAEDSIISQLAQERQLNFLRDVSPSSISGIIFDAVAEKGEIQFIVETRFSPSGLLSRRVVERIRDKLSIYYFSIPDVSRRRTSFILAIGVGDEAELSNSDLIRRYTKMVAAWNIPVEIKLYRTTDLGLC